MADERYSRWQLMAIGQLSVAVALVSGLSVAGLGGGLSLLQDPGFKLFGGFRYAFVGSMLLFIFSAFASCGSVISRTLDFRLTARKVRKEKNPNYDKSLAIFGFGPDGYGRATWGLFWCGCITLVIGAILLVTSVAGGYWDRWIPPGGTAASAGAPSSGSPKFIEPSKPASDAVPTGER